MDEYRAQQIEALETLAEFNVGLLKNINIVITELEGERLDDTDKFLDGITEAMNWEIQVLNGTLDLINENEVVIDKAEFNAAVSELSKALADKDDKKSAEGFRKVYPFFEKLGEVASLLTTRG